MSTDPIDVRFHSVIECLRQSGASVTEPQLSVAHAGTDVEADIFEADFRVDDLRGAVQRDLSFEGHTTISATYVLPSLGPDDIASLHERIDSFVAGIREDVPCSGYVQRSISLDVDVPLPSDPRRGTMMMVELVVDLGDDEVANFGITTEDPEDTDIIANWNRAARAICGFSHQPAGDSMALDKRIALVVEFLRGVQSRTTEFSRTFRQADRA